MPAPATPNVAYIAGTHTTPTPVSLPVFRAPFDGVPLDLELRQDWQCRLANFTRTALDTPHPDYTNFLLANESELQDLGGGMVRWTRIYLRLPTAEEIAAYPRLTSDFRGSINFTFPGFSGVTAIGVIGFGGDADGRQPQPLNVPLLVERAFYHTTDPGADIPIQQQFQVTYGATNVPVEHVNDVNGLWDDTTPSRSAYDALVATEEYLVAEATTIKPWLGNFYIAETFKVKAK